MKLAWRPVHDDSHNRPFVTKGRSTWVYWLGSQRGLAARPRPCNNTLGMVYSVPKRRNLGCQASLPSVSGYSRRTAIPSPTGRASNRLSYTITSIRSFPSEINASNRTSRCFPVPSARAASTTRSTSPNSTASGSRTLPQRSTRLIR